MAEPPTVGSIRKDNPILGTKYYIAFTFGFSLQFVFGKITYARNPNLSVDVFLLVQSMCANMIVMTLLNFKSKSVLIDEIPKSNHFLLAFRSIQGSLGSLINNSCVKRIPLSEIGVVNNLSPICCSVLALTILKEKMTIGQTVFLVLTTLGVIMVVLGKQSDSKSTSVVPGYLYMLLAINPFLTGAGSIALRKMTQLS